MESNINKYGKQSIAGALLPYQQKWASDNASVRVIEKSRRVGISWASAAESALLAAARKGMDVWYIGYNKDMAIEFINDCGDWAKNYNLAASQIGEVVIDDEDGDILSYQIKFDSGWRVTALSSRPANLRGKQGMVIIDEAAFHDDLDGLIKAAIALLMWGGKVCIISTHFGDDNAFNEIVKDIRAGKKPYSLHRVTLDDALAQGLYKRICLKLGKNYSVEAENIWRQELIDFYGDHADEELFCVPSQGSGKFLTRALIESCMSEECKVVRWQCKDDFAQRSDAYRQSVCADFCEHVLAPLLKDDGVYFFGEDFGRSGDLTVIWILERLQNLAYNTPFIVELRNVPFRQQEQVLFYVCDSLKIRGGALDARGNGQYLAEVAMQRYSASCISQIMLSAEWYRENMPPYKSALEDRTITIPKDSDVLDDHRALVMEKGVAKVAERTRGTDKGQRHGDSAIAGALALYAARFLDSIPIEYQRVKGRGFNFNKGAW